MQRSEFTEAAYAGQLDAKRARLRAMMKEFSAPQPSVYPSPPVHYRLRAEFRFWREGDDAFYAMFDPADPRRVLRIEEFPPASRRINALMHALRKELLAGHELRERLFQVEFLSTLSGEALITLIYHRHLDAAWEREARELDKRLDAYIIGRSRKQRIVLSQPYVTETFLVDGERLRLRQPEGCFVQPNGEVNRGMLQWARECAPADDSGLVELYCGIGNFTVALAPRFDSVLATEINKTAIEAARFNLTANGIGNCFVARLSSEEASAALQRSRPFRRLARFDLDAFRPGTVFVDPPRAGLDAGTLQFVARFPRIIYVSCNPETLCANLRALNASHRIERLALFDQFPYTDHMECGVLLRKSQGPAERGDSEHG